MAAGRAQRVEAGGTMGSDGRGRRPGAEGCDSLQNLGTAPAASQQGPGTSVLQPHRAEFCQQPNDQKGFVPKTSSREPNPANPLTSSHESLSRKPPGGCRGAPPLTRVQRSASTEPCRGKQELPLRAFISKLRSARGCAWEAPAHSHAPALSTSQHGPLTLLQRL